ncbi:cation:proton antiporter domain-containing protein [Schauerella aestuarii]|uniref:cation:proton antiporter domain-containing protein n=1 Tax=Schauerella aestuarii TaxID=2511204 RepID=UPI00136CBC17|nr:cation:proton antiporter [Achromobacter aestuarii]MYZ43028.1 transporter [Achromobacter aestuarii]
MNIVTALLLAAVICVPLAHRLKMGAIPGYLFAGILIGPSGLAVVTDVQNIMRFSEWGVVMMLFVIGLELTPLHLWAMRRQVFGTGSLQMAACGAVLGVVFGAGLRHLAGMEWQMAILCGFSLALSSTAVALALLQERGVMRTPLGNASLGVLLLQDIVAIPLLAAAGLLGAGGAQAPSLGVIALAILAIFVGKKLRMLDWAAKTGLPEMYTAATLLMVFGTAQLFIMAGVSAGFGGLLIGVVMARSRHRDELAKTIEPFKGLLLGAFFLTIGMSINLHEIREYWPYVIAGVLALLGIKILIVYGIARLIGLPHYHRLFFAVTLAQGGEFGFAIFAEAWDNGLLSLAQRDLMSAVVAISMATVPLLLKALEAMPARLGGIKGMPYPPAGFTDEGTVAGSAERKPGV